VYNKLVTNVYTVLFAFIVIPERWIHDLLLSTQSPHVQWVNHWYTISLTPAKRGVNSIKNDRLVTLVCSY